MQLICKCFAHKKLKRFIKKGERKLAKQLDIVKILDNVKKLNEATMPLSQEFKNDKLNLDYDSCEGDTHLINTLKHKMSFRGKHQCHSHNSTA